MPRTNEDINEEWISDKSRFACDGLKRQRLTYPMMKDHTGELKPCDWEDVVLTVAKVLDSTPGDKLAAVVGGMADAEVRAARYRSHQNTGQVQFSNTKNVYDHQMVLSSNHVTLR